MTGNSLEIFLLLFFKHYTLVVFGKTFLLRSSEIFLKSAGSPFSWQVSLLLGSIESIMFFVVFFARSNLLFFQEVLFGAGISNFNPSFMYLLIFKSNGGKMGQDN